ncbi:hypothetical protein ANI02nite_07180 [Acetobacter nitrogenifigens DSM 23921 = NBRC 105050]|uniref:Uncharacterized protein n=1 Tax=Acetobacter nitrogenifigens DSM 23921 = NBRC 105050 TaxID=1120919 RepID=A0A511X7A7_9PROT|nr:hypothetical protein ANI02nite_07180 [Acetobacter nitrogenifigens DSM 23921 = NBRC 105050]
MDGRTPPALRSTRFDPPFSLIRTMTVGSGFTPDLLDPAARAAGARGLSTVPAHGTIYRRWGVSPRPENVRNQSSDWRWIYMKDKIPRLQEAVGWNVLQFVAGLCLERG